MRPRRFQTAIFFAALGASVSATPWALAQGAPAQAKPAPTSKGAAAPAGQGTPAPTGKGAAAPLSAPRTAADIYKDAMGAFKKGDYETALKGFQDVWEREKKPKVIANAGRAELQLKKYRDAAEHLELGLRLDAGVPPDDRIKPEDRKDLFSDLGEAKKHVTTLVITAAPTQAEIWVDGAKIGAEPLGRDLFVESGHHKVEARAGKVTDVKEMDTKDGSEWPVTLDATEKADPDKDKKKLDPTPFPTRTVVIATGLGLTAVAIGVGIGSVFTSSDKAQVASSKFEPATGPNSQAEATFKNIAFWSFVAAGLVGGGTLYYVVSGRGKPEPGKDKPSSEVKAGFLVGPNGGGALLQGSF